MKVLLKAGAVGPGLVVSTLVWLIIGAGLPAWAQMVLFYGGLAAVILMTAGVAERRAAQVLFAARRLNQVELTAMAPIITELSRLGLGPPLTDIYVARRPRAPVAIAHGRRSVIVADEVVQTLLNGQLPPSEVVAVLCHAAAVARTGLSRQDAAIACYSIPWRLLKRGGGPIGVLLGVAWKVRFVVFGVAIWQCLVEGPRVAGPWAAVVLGLVLAATYTTPRCASRWEQYVVEVGDRELAALGLGMAMAAFLRRLPETRSLVVRLQTLDSKPTQAAPLRLVGT